MQTFNDIAALREHIVRARSAHRVVLVPTMGALHAGHRACIDVARDEPHALVVVSIFVNPTQFGPTEDFDNYPRLVDEDVARCRDWGVDVVFAPSTNEMYADTQLCWVDVLEMTDHLCGASRPGHFRGVATVVAKLFNIVGPDVAVFGQKDAQQALVIRAFTRQLNFPTELRLARTVREPDGLAMSSRNAYLSAEERRRAAGIFASFDGVRKRIADGERSAPALEAFVRQTLDGNGIDSVEYAEVRSADDLSALEHIEGRAILAVAARVGSTRLIDNVVFDVSGDALEWDVSLF